MRWLREMFASEKVDTSQKSAQFASTKGELFQIDNKEVEFEAI